MSYDVLPGDVSAVLFPQGQEPPPSPKTIGLPTEQPSVLAAAARQANWIVAGFASMHPKFAPQAGYDVVSEIQTDPRYWARRDAFIGSQSPEETAFIKTQVDQQDQDEQTLSNSGFTGTLAQFGMGMLDPFMLMGAGEIYRGGKIATDIAKSAMSAASYNAIAATPGQAALYATKPDPKALDFIYSIGSATLLGGILGGTASKFMSAGERKAAIDAFDKYKTAMRNGDVPPAGFGGAASVGAAAADLRELKPVGFGKVGEAYTAGLDLLRKVPVVGKPAAAVIDAPAALVRNVGPVNRVFYGPFVQARRAMADLADSAGILFEENLVGRPTVAGGGPSIETQARMAVEGGRYRMGQMLNALYSDYRWGQQRGFAGQLQAKVQELTGTVRDNLMSFEEFKTEISKAMRRNDQSQIPQVQEAAQVIRRDIFEPWKKAAIDAKLLPEDVGVETADSYLTRLYDREKIIQTRPQFESRITDWLTDTQNHNAQIQERLRDNLNQREKMESDLRKLAGRHETANRQYLAIEQRLSERQMEATATERRYDTVDQRNADQQAHVQDIRDFIADLKDSGNTAEIAAQVRELEKEVAAIEKGGRPATETDLKRDTEAMRRSVLTGPMRQAVRVLTGKGNLPKGVMPFWKWVAKQGGLKDTGGELRQMIGSEVTKGGKRALVQADGMAIDTLQQKLAEEFPELRVRGYGKEHNRPPEAFDDEIREAIVKSHGGEEPSWYLAEKASKQDQEVVGIVDELDRLMNEGLIPEMKTQDQFVDFLLGRDEDMSEADYDKIMADLDSGSASMDRRIAGADVQAMADTRRESIGIIRDSMERAKTGLRSARTQEKVGAGRVKEAGIAARRNMSRAEMLDQRSTLAQQKMALLDAAQSNAQKEIERLRLSAEEDVRAWKGKSSAEALSAFERRDEAERIRGLKKEAGIYAGKDQRLTGADNPVDSAIRRMLASDKNMSPEELKSLAVEIVDRILSTPDGRLSYDAPSGGPTLGAPREGPPPRGPLAARQFMIPDHMIEDWLVNDIARVANSYLHTMVPDTLITQRFGTVDMEEAFKKLRDEHTAMREGVTDGKKLAELDSRYRKAVNDLAGVRDRIRHVYGHTNSEPMRNLGRAASSMGVATTLADMGGSGIAQFNDVVGPVIRYGFTKVFKDGYAPFLKALTDKNSGGAKAAMQWRAVGIGTEMTMDIKPLQEIGEEYHPHSKFERGMKAAADYYMIGNLSAPITSKAKSIAATVASSEILRAAKAVTEGTATAKELRALGESSITPDLAQRIVSEFEKGGENIDGVMLPNTADWTDAQARLAFEGAVSHEVNISVISPGQEKPLWLSHPVARLIGQFKSFTGSATTRIMLAGLQRRDAETLQGVFAHVAMGMLSYKAYSVVSGRDTSDRPQDWIKEGISRSGVVGWFDEGNALLAKFSAGNVDAYKMIGADKPLGKYMSRSALGQLMGPSWGMAESAVQAIYGLSDGTIKPEDVDSLRRIMPFQNYFVTRQLLDKVDEATAGFFGGPPREMSH